MTVFTYAPERGLSPDAMNPDEFKTTWMHVSPRCLFCGEGFRRGQKVWHWGGSSRGDDINAHAVCVAKSARGLMLDIVECLR